MEGMRGMVVADILYLDCISVNILVVIFLATHMACESSWSRDQNPNHCSNQRVSAVIMPDPSYPTEPQGNSYILAIVNNAAMTTGMRVKR